MLGVFADRSAAGQALASELLERAHPNPLVLGMARGGVPVAYEVAERLQAPLDVLVVRKIGAPGNPELAIGAVAEGGPHLFNHGLIESLMVSRSQLKQETSRADDELERRVALYRGNQAALPLSDHTVIVVDDGLATGASARAALLAVAARGATRTILAVPVGAPETVVALRSAADEVICLSQPPQMQAVGLWYREFNPTSDEQVIALLEAANRRHEP